MGHPETALRAPEAGPFLEALKIAGNVTEACTLAGVGRATVYRWRDEDPAFKADWEAACDFAWDGLEREAYRRAREGWEEPVYQGGELVGHVRKFSDTMLVTMLKAKRAKEFRDNHAVEHTGPGGGPIVLDLSKMLPGKEPA